MIPFFIFYSMFGFQRVGDLIWSFGDQRGRGFLLGATAGRTTLIGRGPAALRRAVADVRARVPELPRVRPRVRVRGRRARARRHPAHVRARTRGLLLLPHALQRELRAAADARRRRGRHRARHVPAAAAPTAEHTHRAQILASGPMVLQALEAQTDARRAPRRRRRRVERARLEAAARRRARVRALEPAAPEPSRRARRTSPSSSRDADGPDRRGHRLGAGGARLRSPGSCRSPTSCSAPTATASPTSAPRCGATSRSTPPTWWSAVLDGLAQTGDVKAETVAEAIERYEIDADAPDPRLV